MNDIIFRELAAEEIPGILPLVELANPKIPAATLASRLEAMRDSPYRCIGGFAGERLVAICGMWPGTKFYCGKYIELDNLFILEEYRRHQLGHRLFQWIEQLARQEGVEALMLDTYVTNTASHKFYYREGYEIVGYHFWKKLA